MAEGQLLPLPEEAEQERLVQVEAQMEQERQRVEQLEAYVRSLGVDPDNLPNP